LSSTISTRRLDVAPGTTGDASAAGLSRLDELVWLPVKGGLLSGILTGIAQALRT
jgi:hypothetical protein